MDAVEVYVEGEWVTIAADTVYQALAAFYEVDHSVLGHITIVPRSFPMRGPLRRKDIAHRP